MTAIDPAAVSALEGDTARDALEAALIARALTDDTFRQALLADPRACLTELAGHAPPDGLRIHVHQETETEVHVVLRHRCAPTAELSDDDLMAVVGGAALADHLKLQGPAHSAWVTFLGRIPPE